MTAESSELSIERADGSDRAAALLLLLRDHPAEFRSQHAATILSAARAGTVSLDHLFVAKRGERVVAATWANPVAGRMAGMWPPQFEIDKDETEIALPLLQAAEHSLLLSHDTAMWQASLALHDSISQAHLAAAGFRPLTTLIHLTATLPEQTVSDPRIEFEQYHASEKKRLEKLLEATYEATLDCPELDSLRSIQDCLDGYLAVGESGHRHWYFARRDQSDIGCLLLAVHRNGQLELVYMGLTRSSRGQGYGQALCTEALRVGTAEGACEVFTAVDDRNGPAQKVYLNAGFRETERRLIMVKPQG